MYICSTVHTCMIIRMTTRPSWQLDPLCQLDSCDNSTFVTTRPLCHLNSLFCKYWYCRREGLCSKIFNTKIRWVEWPTIECATYDFDCIFFMNKSGINFNKIELQFTRKPILFPERDACPNIFLRVELSVSSWCVMGLEAWRQIFGPCHAAAPYRCQIQNYTTCTCIVTHIGHAICHGGIDKVQQQIGIVWPIACQLKSCDYYNLFFYNYCFENVQQLNIEKEPRQKALKNLFN